MLNVSTSLTVVLPNSRLGCEDVGVTDDELSGVGVAETVRKRSVALESDPVKIASSTGRHAGQEFSTFSGPSA